MSTLGHICDICPECAKVFAEWLQVRKEAARGWRQAFRRSFQ